MTVLRRLGIATRGFRGGSGGEIVRIGYVEDSLTAKIEDTSLTVKLGVQQLDAKITEGNSLAIDLQENGLDLGATLTVEGAI